MIHTINEEEIRPTIIACNAAMEHIQPVSSVEELAKVIHTPYDLLATFINNKILFTNPNGGNAPVIWPNILIKAHSGTCFDFAVFAHEFFKLNKIKHAIGFTIFIDEIYGTSVQIGHVYPIFKDPNNHYHIWNYFTSGIGDINGHFTNYQEAVEKAGKYFDVLYKSEYMIPVSSNSHIPRTCVSTYLESPYDLRFIKDNYNKQITQMDLLSNSSKILEFYAEVAKVRNGIQQGIGSRTFEPINVSDIENTINLNKLPIKKLNTLSRFLKNFNSNMKHSKHI